MAHRNAEKAIVLLLGTDAAKNLAAINPSNSPANVYFAYYELSELRERLNAITCAIPQNSKYNVDVTGELGD
jgi:hypothetical protein